MPQHSLIQAHLNFDGVCEEAIKFYQQALGAEVCFIMRFKDSPVPAAPHCAPADSNKIMHAQLRVGETVLMVSDGQGAGHPRFAGFVLALSLPTAAEVDHAFGALAAGGQIQMPLAPTFFSARYGMLADRFGVAWMVMVRPAQPTECPAPSTS